MRIRILSALVLFAAGVGHAQPPTAPPPRPVANEPLIDNLTFAYSPTPTPLPALDIESVNGRVEVRWADGKATYGVSGARVTVRGGTLVISGSDGELVTLRQMTRDGVTLDRNAIRGRGVTVDTARGAFVVDGPGQLTTPRDR